jgi:hypothetical protein
MPTDAATDFWVSQGGQDNAYAAGWREMSENSQLEAGLRDRTAREEDVYDATRAALDETAGREDDRSDWDSSREHREWLSERYPDTKLGDYGRAMLSWHDRFRSDPAGAREAWIRHYAAQPPFSHRSKPKEKPAEVRPVERISNLRPDDYADDAAAAYKKVAADARENDEYAGTAELRQLVKERLPGISFAKFLEHCRAIDQASLDDPHGVATRFAVFSGMPATEQQAAELHQGANQQALVAELQAGVGRVVASGLLPGLGTDEVDNAIVDVLLDPNFPRDPNGDRGIDLECAYHAALPLLALRRQETANKESAERARNASRSVSGAPSPGATSPQRNGGGGSVHDDARAAYYSAHAKA